MKAALLLPVYILTALIFLGFTIGALIGWVMNIIKLVTVLAETGFDAAGYEILLRVAGIPLTPVGAIFGWF